MISRSLARLAHMSAAELAWRGSTAARTLFDRGRLRLLTPRWLRTDLLAALAPLEELTTARAALKARRWDDAQRELARHFARGPRRFTIHPQSRPALSQRIRHEFPDATRRPGPCGPPRRRCDRSVLGLRFDTPVIQHKALKDTKAGVSAPRSGRLAVGSDAGSPAAGFVLVDGAYLDPSCGDQDRLELNRHRTGSRSAARSGGGRPPLSHRCLAEVAAGHANPPLTGVNWASMLEVGFRSIRGSGRFSCSSGSSRRRSSRRRLVDLLVGLDRQLTQIERNLSHYFSPNTHLGEALALYAPDARCPSLPRAHGAPRSGVPC
jgi:hypothetical protein